MAPIVFDLSSPATVFDLSSPATVSDLSSPATVSEVLDELDWTRRRDLHSKRVAAILGPYLRQRSAGAANPVIDFLFAYYTLRPGQLERWHPGFDVTLAG